MVEIVESIRAPTPQSLFNSECTNTQGIIIAIRTQTRPDTTTPLRLERKTFTGAKRLSLANFETIILLLLASAPPNSRTALLCCCFIFVFSFGGGVARSPESCELKMCAVG